MTPLERMMWARDVEVYGAAKAVLWAVVARVGLDLTCTCPRSELALYAGLRSTRGVSKALDELESRGVLVVEGYRGDRGDGSWNSYRLTPESVVPAPEEEVEPSADGENVIPPPMNVVPTTENVVPTTLERRSPPNRAGEKAGEEAGEGTEKHVAPAAPVAPEAKRPRLELTIPAPPPEPEPKRPKAPTKQQQQVAEVWAAFCACRIAWKPTARPSAHPPSSWGVAARIAEHGVEALVTMIRWAHTSPDGSARYLRGENDSSTEHMEQTLFRKEKTPKYVEASRSWLSRGAPTAGPQPAATTGPTPPRPTLSPAQQAEAAWTSMLSLPGFQRPNRTKPPSIGGTRQWWLGPEGDEAEHNRRAEALRTAGGYGGWCMVDNDFQRRDFRLRFLAAYQQVTR